MGPRLAFSNELLRWTAYALGTEEARSIDPAEIAQNMSANETPHRAPSSSFASSLVGSAVKAARGALVRLPVILA